MSRLSEFVDQRCFTPIENPKVISKEDCDFFNENGFLVIKNFVDTQIIQDIKKDIETLITNKESWITAPELKLDSVKNYFNSLLITNLISDVLGPSNMFLGFVINKEKGNTEIKPWHQDGIYWGGDTQKVCALFTPLTYFGIDNSPLYVIPGSHKLGRIYHWEEPGYNLVCDVSSLRDHLCIIASPGDIVLVHSLTIHASKTSKEDNPRMSLGSHWVNMSDSSFIFDEATIKYYPQMEKEI